MFFNNRAPPPVNNGDQNGIHCTWRQPKEYKQANNIVIIIFVSVETIGHTIDVFHHSQLVKKGLE